MDRIDRALAGVDDNSVKIEGMLKTLSEGFSMISRQCASGTPSFGVIKTSKSGAAVFAAFDGEACTLYFGGTAVASGKSPLMAVVKGRGELSLSAIRSNARVLAVGARADG